MNTIYIEHALQPAVKRFFFPTPFTDGFSFFLNLKKLLLNRKLSCLSWLCFSYFFSLQFAFQETFALKSPVQLKLNLRLLLMDWLPVIISDERASKAVIPHPLSQVPFPFFHKSPPPKSQWQSFLLLTPGKLPLPFSSLWPLVNKLPLQLWAFQLQVLGSHHCQMSLVVTASKCALL